MPPHPPAARKLLVVSAAIAVCALLAACGGSSSTLDPANSSAARQEDALKFSKCMREHGIKSFPNPEVSEGHVQLHVKAGGPGGIEASPQAMEAAMKACQKYQEAMAPKLTPQERVQREEALQKFAACMRQHGIHVETGSGPGGGIGIRIGHKPSGETNGAKHEEEGPNPESPTFQKAQEACQKLLPSKPGAPKGGPLAGTKHAPGGERSDGETGSATSASSG